MSGDLDAILRPVLTRARNRGCLEALRLAGRQCVTYADQVSAVLCNPDFREELQLEAGGEVRGEVRAARFLGEMFLRVADECERQL